MLSEDYALAKERRFGRAGFALKAAAMPLSVVPHAMKVLLSRRLPDFATRLGGLSILLRLRLWRAAQMLKRLSGKKGT